MPLLSDLLACFASDRQVSGSHLQKSHVPRREKNGKNEPVFYRVFLYVMYTHVPSFGANERAFLLAERKIIEKMLGTLVSCHDRTAIGLLPFWRHVYMFILRARKTKYPVPVSCMRTK